MTSDYSQHSHTDVDNKLMMIGDDLQFTARTLEVDYEKNPTELYQAITDQKICCVVVTLKTTTKIIPHL